MTIGTGVFSTFPPVSAGPVGFDGEREPVKQIVNITDEHREL
jgi:hypothetical protein